MLKSIRFMSLAIDKDTKLIDTDTKQMEGNTKWIE